MLTSTAKFIAAVVGSVLLAHHFPVREDTSNINIIQTFTFLGISIAGLLIWSILIYPNFLDPLRHLPQARTPWRLQVRRWIFEEPSPPQVFEMVKSTTNNGMLAYQGIGGNRRVVLTMGDAIKEALVQKSYEFHKRPIARMRLGQTIGWGLLTAEGEVHKVQRKNLQPAFSFRAIKDLHPLFWSKACEFVETFSDEIRTKSESLPPKITTQIAPWISRAALDIIGIAAWGEDFGTVQNPETDFNVKYRKQFQFSGVDLFKVMLARALPPWISSNLPLSANTREGIQASRQKCREIISKRRHDKNISDRKDILSVAMNSDVFDDAALEEQLMTMLAAGHETSALSATYACYLLCKHPDIQERLRAEIRSNLPSPTSGQEVDADQLNSVHYLRAVTNEVLRLMPAAPQIRREAVKDTVIQGQVIPKGTQIIVTAWISSRLKSSWGDDAEQFNPERWMKPHQENTGGAKSNFDFMSFSQGPRSCIGQGFARGEFLALLSVLAGRFRMSLEDPNFEPDLFFGITMRPKKGIIMNLEIVEGW